jgi:hypothetical protein
VRRQQSDITATFLGAGIDPNPLGTRAIGSTTIAGQSEGTDLRRVNVDPCHSGKPVAALLEIDDGGMNLDVVHHCRFATPRRSIARSPRCAVSPISRSSSITQAIALARRCSIPI